MTNTLPAPDRDELRALLLSWQRGERTFHQVVDEAEAIEERTWQGIDVIEFATNDPRRIPTEVVSALSMGYVQPRVVEDIVHLLRCLDAPPGEEEEYIVTLWENLERRAE